MNPLRRISTFAFIFTLLPLSSALIAGPVTTDYGSETVFGYTTGGVYRASQSYCDGDCVTRLKPVTAIDLSAGGSANFLAVLNAAFPAISGWSFQTGSELSDNSLVVKTYAAQGTLGRVGAEFHVKYVPHDEDPTSTIHWIQVVTDNHNVTLNPGHGNAENIVDNPFSPAGRSPYYDDGGAADGTDFYDFPGRTDALNSHTWLAQLYLVSGPAAGAPGLVTIWSGVEWGWENECPEPATYIMFGLAGPLAFVLRRRLARR